MDDFLYRYRFLIGGILVLIIIAGAGVICWDKSHRTKINKENQTIAELRQQNEELRQQLSENSSKSIAGTENIKEDQSDKININTADATELDKLPGIGPARAADIIAYRESHGGFKSIEELKNIKGIGDKTFENLKDLVTVGE
jgi:competence protein ComEA